MGERAADTCAICTGTPWESSGFDHDLRTLRLTNGYQLTEGDDTGRLHFDEPTRLYEVKTCKDCRGDFIEMLWSWLRGDQLHLNRVEATPERNIPVREAGRTIMLTRDEWEARRSGESNHGE